ncbi:MAG TPA: hypothetical protein VNQ90_17695 [Chthoniobacteraceae bacterium]|nr:hypothetical protein [Chthoniobacteraceae bacterium]
MSVAPEPFLLRFFEPERDYQTVRGWWEAHGWSAVPVQVLPRLGIVAERGGEPTAAGWLYMDNSVGVGWLEWLVARPDASPRDVYRALASVIEFIRSEAKRMGYHTLISTCRQESLGRLLERNGFNQSDTGVSHFVGFLDQ